MKIFIGKIPRELRAEDLSSYFERFGEVADFNFKGSFAFVEYRDEDVSRRVLETRDHRVGDFEVFVEESVGRKRQRNDDYDRRPPAGGYDDYSRGRPYNEPPYYDRYSDRRDYDDRRAPEPYRGYSDYPSDRNNCPHCSRCEIHGIPPRRSGGDFDRPKRPKRDHPNDVNKLVIESLPVNVNINDVEDLIRKEGFDVVFSRITARGDSAIVELRSIEEKEDAMNKLVGKEINGTPISVRNFKTSYSSGYSQNDNYDSEKREDQPERVDVYSGIDSVNVD